MEIPHFIGHESIFSPEDNRYPFLNPSTGQIIGYQACANAKTVDHAVSRAHFAKTIWSHFSAKERMLFLTNIADKLEEHSNTIARTETINMGQPLHRPCTSEEPSAAEYFRYYAAMLQCHSNEFDSCDSKKIRPAGIVAIITCSHTPLAQLCRALAPALAWGNTTIIKPSEYTPASISLLANIFRDVDLPPGVCNIVYGQGKSTGSCLVAHPHVSRVVFTGSRQTAQTIAQTCGQQLKKYLIKLRYRPTHVIFADSDFGGSLDSAIATSFLGKHSQGSSGQMGAEIYIEQQVYKTFLDAFGQKTQNVKYGPAGSEQTQLGPLIKQNDLNQMKNFLISAQEKGAKIHTEASPPDLQTSFVDGFFAPPTVLSGIDPLPFVGGSEISAPLVYMIPFKDHSQAAHLLNQDLEDRDIRIWTNSLRTSHSIIKELATPTISLNKQLRSLHLSTNIANISEFYGANRYIF